MALPEGETDIQNFALHAGNVPGRALSNSGPGTIEWTDK